MERLHNTALEDTAAVFRSLLIQYVSRYTKEGNAAMIAYADKLPAIRSSNEFLDQLKEFGWLRVDAPPLYDCLESFSGGACPGIDGFLYWSNAKFGLKPVFSITHVMIFRTMHEGQPWVFIAFKQIYADHYIESSLAVAVLAQDSADPANPALWFYISIAPRRMRSAVCLAVLSERSSRAARATQWRPSSTV